MVQVKLHGFYGEDFIADRRQLTTTENAREGTLPAASVPSTEIHDARPRQAPAGSDHAFFEHHGFVLLDHTSSVTDWDPDPARDPSDSEIARRYLPEVDALIRRRLLPGRTIDVRLAPQAFARRGPGTANPFYAEGVHQDFGLSADDYQQSLEAFVSAEIGQRWRDRYDSDAVDGYVVIDFWRTVSMDEPLRHMPLAICDPKTVEVTDTIPTGLLDFAPTGKPTNQLGLRFKADQKWYFYPEMLGTEVLAFKVFQCFKTDRRPRVQTCFHTAFPEPGAPDRAAHRQSCEFRAGVFFLNGGTA